MEKEQVRISAKVGGLGLCYYEPQGDAPTGNFLTVLQQDGFVMRFRAHLKKIGLRPEAVVVPLLKEVRRLADREKAPGGRDGCGDCEIVERWRMDYNHYRPHSSLGYMTPAGFAELCRQAGCIRLHTPGLDGVQDCGILS